MIIAHDLDGSMRLHWPMERTAEKGSGQLRQCVRAADRTLFAEVVLIDLHRSKSPGGRAEGTGKSRSLVETNRP
jgi:hypothetical protein